MLDNKSISPYNTFDVKERFKDKHKNIMNYHSAKEIKWQKLRLLELEAWVLLVDW